MDNLFDVGRSMVDREYTPDDLVVFITLRKRQGFEWTDIDVESDDYCG
jgi:hypothetical protein